jgi:hypothetical protein
MSSNEKYIRWQGITLNQVTFVINLLLGLATATLGFSASLLKDEKFIPTGKVKCLFTFALLSQLIALLFGIIAVISRTLDFRCTAQIARKKFGEGESVKSTRLRVKRLGKTTWFSFWVQLSSFGLGILSLIVSILMIYSDKLF